MAISAGTRLGPYEIVALPKKDADPDLALPKQAKAELAALR
jgi:hypothetical protein